MHTDSNRKHAWCLKRPISLYYIKPFKICPDGSMSVSIGHNGLNHTGNAPLTYRSLLVYIRSICQKVHHTVIVAFPGSPYQRSCAILYRKDESTTTQKYESLIIFMSSYQNIYQHVVTLSEQLTLAPCRSKRWTISAWPRPAAQMMG